MYRKLICALATLLCCQPLLARDTSHLAPLLKQNDEGIAWRKSEQHKLQLLTDKELLEQFSKAKIEWDGGLLHKKLTVEMLLTEMIHRGGKVFENAIIEKVQTQRKALQVEQAREQKEQVREHISPENLPMLTALRRIQNKPDPVEIIVKQVGAISTTRELPCFSVVLKNVDVEKQPFHFTFGGDYRSGRLARWTFEVIDAKGNLLPPRHREAGWGGGVCTIGDLEYGKTWDTQLPMGSYARISEPGEYTVRVLYHNTVTIADYIDLTGVIVCASEPFKVTVGKPVPKKVFVQAGSVEKVQSLVRNLKGKTTVRTVCSKYGLSLYDFIDPTSPEGQLLMMEWSAVPGLLELLKDKSITKEQRAWVFTMLHTLTNAEDMSPFARSNRGLIADYEYRGTGCSGSGGGTIRPEVQQKFAEAWLKLAPELWEFVIPADVTLKDSTQLEGYWNMCSGSVNGIEIRGEARIYSAKGETTLRFYLVEDQKGHSFYPNFQTHLKAKYLIDGVKKTIDYDITQGVHQGRKQLGIYKIEGDTVTFCFGAPGKDRPDDFTSNPGSERTLSVWKRYK